MKVYAIVNTNGTMQCGLGQLFSYKGVSYDGPLITDRDLAFGMADQNNTFRGYKYYSVIEFDLTEVTK